MLRLVVGRNDMGKNKIIEVEVEEISDANDMLNFQLGALNKLSNSSEVRAQEAFRKANMPKNYSWEEIEEMYNEIDEQENEDE